MNRWAILAVGGLGFATASAAQSGPVAQQSSDQLICQLSGDCAATAAGTQDKPRTRGFSIARPGQARLATTPATTAPTVRSAVAPSQRLRTATPSAAASGRFAVAAPARPGRADLLITFVTGSATLTEQAKTNAQQFVVALGSPQLASMKFAIEGHTDAVGTRDHNLVLSQQRAQSVVDFLTSKGVDRSRFTVKGYGPDRPVNASNPKAAVNRRVEVVKL